PLAVLQGDDDDLFSISDCRVPVRLTTDRGCVTRTVGDGISSRGDFLSVQAAIDSLPPEGGLIEIRPGLYQEAISITSRTGITLQGCGESSVLRTRTTPPSSAVIQIRSSTGITLSNLKIEAAEQPGLTVALSRDTVVERVHFVAGTIAGAEFEEET